MCRIEEAAPILTDGSTHIKFRNGTPQTPTGNLNGFVSSDELHQQSKKTLQGLLPQVNAPTSKHLLKPRSVPNSPLHFFLIFFTDRIRHWDARCCSPAPKKPARYDTQSVCSIRSIPQWLSILSQINLIHRCKIVLRFLIFSGTTLRCAPWLSTHHILHSPSISEHLVHSFYPHYI
jgi:hypothetical protein